MTTTPTRRKALRAGLGAVVAGAAGTARRSHMMLIVLALALGTILLSLSATVAQAAPGGGPGDNNNDPPSIPASQAAQVPLQVHASENPVIFSPFETTKTITFTWNPVPQTTAVIVDEDGHPLWIKQVQPGEQGPLELTVTPGKTYTIQLKTVTYQIGPPLTITTKKPVIITTAPEMPEITISPR